MTLPSASLSFHAWPPEPPGGGQQVSRIHLGVLVLHIPTGIAVVCESERSQMRNREEAVKRLEELLKTWASPGDPAWAETWRAT